MEINELIKLGVEELKDRDFSNPMLETRLILAKLLNVDKSYIYAYADNDVSKEISDKFIMMIKQRSKGYPFQYLMNEKEFMGLDFYIEEGVLVPRPDTEILVEYIIEYINENYKDEKIKVLDLGIGSGAISLSIAHRFPNIFVYGVDIDPIPIKVSNINKKRFNLSNVEFLLGDMFNPIKDIGIKKEFHIIASNPPYIPKKEIEKLQVEVKTYEPRLALDGGDDGLKFYREITSKSREYLVGNGLLIYEIGFNQGNDVKNILIQEGFKDIKVLKDLQGLDRVILGFL